MKAVILLGLVVGCLSQFPGQTWERSTPEAEGMSSAVINDAFDYAGRAGDQETFCVSVHRNGKLIADRFWGRDPDVPGPVYPWIIWSISKAITSTLIGSAERDGLLNTEDRAGEYIREWSTPSNDAYNVTIDMLLRHDSGRYYDFFTDFIRSQFQDSQTDFAIGLRQQNPPGAEYQYNQMAIQTLERVISVATNSSLPDFTERELFAPLQFESDSYWQEKSVLVPFPNDPLLYGGMRTTCHDLARFGTLWLHRGNWNGHQVFTDEFYVKGTTYPPPPRAGRAYHWGGYPNIKAQGMGNQFVSYNPEKQLVLTRIGNPISGAFSSGDYINMIMDAFIDEDAGSHDARRELEENISPAEDIEFINFLKRTGATVGASGDIQLPKELLEIVASRFKQ